MKAIAISWYEITFTKCLSTHFAAEYASVSNVINNIKNGVMYGPLSMNVAAYNILDKKVRAQNSFCTCVVDGFFHI